MARLIPPIFPEDAPPGEKSVYRVLAEDRMTDDWIVLHSLNIAEHVRKPEGEADFVIIAPRLGILVVEVKSHQHFTFDDGVWRLGSQAPTTRGPFKQASEAMYSIRKYLIRKKVDLSSTPVLSAVWFTEARARTMLRPTNEWFDWQILDSEDLKKDPIGTIRRAFEGGLANLEATFKGYSSGGVGPSQTEAKQIAMLLRPNFEFGVVAGDVRAARQHQLVRFVEEQFLALDAMSDNQAVLFTGPAGSGKTFLALEAARREIALGGNGTLMCFNKLLGRRLAADVDEPRLSVGTFHSQLLALTGLKVPEGAGELFWKNELPERAIEVLLELGEPPFDFLIVDEIQDLLTEAYLDVLELTVKGGLAGGRVLMFGDFERQVIYNDGSGRELLRERVPHMPSHRLSMNCRNLPRIGFSVNFFSGLTPGYQRFRRDDDGVNPVLLKYTRGEDQSPLLRQAVEALRDESFDLSEIVVLSPLAADSAAATTTDSWLRSVLVQADGLHAKKGKIRFSSIQAFKGLEAPAVIVTDLDRVNVPNFQSVLYVGLTRATDRVYGLVEKDTGLVGMAGKR
ncbi:NERD domain-containing protein [Micrococcus luteus]|uniref:nuclease-related domain-containing DEAD/DEAH box helicase n=1 Tax=Micrococcus sp. H39-S4 TaxID=3004356 RepID=UPI0022AE96EA|nr:NERD domain-containing protein [Micrococcus sp. H39-S4]MCV7671388.1 NERD domain-containing protein [Micrococcus luteus]MCV7706606.1 NERD domain-containing protein [Micrococcus luteus]MCZ4069958.1 NERD domain-containing protein [Micrococcus sp. H39-S4]